MLVIKLLTITEIHTMIDNHTLLKKVTKIVTEPEHFSKFVKSQRVPRMEYNIVMKYLDILDFLLIQALYHPNALDVSPSLDKITNFVSKTYFQYLESSNEQDVFILRSKYLTLKSWKFFNLMEEEQVMVNADLRLYFNLKGKEPALDTSNNPIADKQFHQYLLGNYTVENLRNFLVVSVNNMELDNPMENFDYGPEPGQHWNEFSQYMPDNKAKTRFNIKTSIKEFQGAGRNYAPDSTSLYIGLYEWNGNLGKKDIQSRKRFWTIGKTLTNFNRPNIIFWDLGSFSGEQIQFGNEQTQTNLVDGAEYVGSETYGFVNTTEFIKNKNLDWYNTDSDHQKILKEIAGALNMYINNTIIMGKFKNFLIFTVKKIYNMKNFLSIFRLYRNW